MTQIVRTRRVLLFAAVLVLAAVAAGGWLASMLRPVPLPPVAGSTPKRIDLDAVGPLFVEYVEPKRGTTLADLVAEADAVLTAGLCDNRVDRVDLHQAGFPYPSSYSIYYFTVCEVVKGEFHEGETVKVARTGGRGTYEPEFPRPGLGERFLMFLRKRPEVEAYGHLYGRVAFREVWGELQSMGPLYREVTRRKVWDVLEELRAGARDAKRRTTRH